MGNSCDTYCAYEEWGQVDFDKEQEQEMRKPVPAYKGLLPDSKAQY